MSPWSVPGVHDFLEKRTRAWVSCLPSRSMEKGQGRPGRSRRALKLDANCWRVFRTAIATDLSAEPDRSYEIKHDMPGSRAKRCSGCMPAARLARRKPGTLEQRLERQTSGGDNSGFYPRSAALVRRERRRARLRASRSSMAIANDHSGAERLIDRDAACSRWPPLAPRRSGCDCAYSRSTMSRPSWAHCGAGVAVSPDGAVLHRRMISRRWARILGPS